MPDLFDHASGLETQFTEMALANQLARAKQSEERESAHECGECGEQIPEKRRQKVPGCSYCTQCQSELERITR